MRVFPGQIASFPEQGENAPLGGVTYFFKFRLQKLAIYRKGHVLHDLKRLPENRCSQVAYFTKSIHEVYMHELVQHYLFESDRY